MRKAVNLWEKAEFGRTEPAAPSVLRSTRNGLMSAPAASRASRPTAASMSEKLRTPKFF